MQENVIKEIYSHIGDDISKKIYINRLNYSLTLDEQYIFNIILQTKEGQDVWNKLHTVSGNKILFGAGRWCENILKIYQDIEWEYIVDNNVDKENKYLLGQRIISFEQYLQKRKKEDLIIITSRIYHQEIYEQLLENGFWERNIIDVGGMLDGMSVGQYFDLPYIIPQNDEIFIDGGAFDGMTSLQFIKWSANQYKKIYVFEPDLDNQNKCIRLLQEHNCKDYELIPKGLWSKDTALYFNANGNGTSAIASDSEASIDVVSIDKTISDKITFIKFDIEGSELQALLGAKETIRKYHPKLAISIYHKLEDVWELPEQILKFHSDYTFYLRHYSIAASETVLYAV